MTCSLGVEFLEQLNHRESATALRPSLSHQAGRALSRFWEAVGRLGVRRVARAKAPAGAKRVRQADRKLSVQTLVRPEINVQKLVKAFHYFALDRAKKQAQQQHRKDGQDRSRP